MILRYLKAIKLQINLELETVLQLLCKIFLKACITANLMWTSKSVCGRNKKRDGKVVARHHFEFKKGLWPNKRTYFIYKQLF